MGALEVGLMGLDGENVREVREELRKLLSLGKLLLVPFAMMRKTRVGIGLCAGGGCVCGSGESSM